VIYLAFNRNQRLEAKLSQLIQKREFTVGVLTVAVVLAVGLILFKGNMQKAQLAKTQQTVLSEAAEQNAKKEPTQAALPQEKAPPQVKKLADTAGEYYATVQPGDNYWKISARSCGTGRYYLSIQAYNGNKPLHPGDTIAVRCEE
jgi:nucleoid-associated protein YgaU